MNGGREEAEKRQIIDREERNREKTQRKGERMQRGKKNVMQVNRIEPHNARERNLVF